MTRLGEMIYENDFEYKVYAVSMRDNATTRISIEIYIVSPEGEMSDLITIQKKDIYTKKNWADVFRGLEADFSRDDIDSIKMKIMDFIKKRYGTSFQSRETLDGLHKAVSSYIRKNEKCSHPKDKGSVTGIFIKGNYGYIDSYMLDDFVKEHKHVGYKRLEILKRLKIMGALNSPDGRNDVLVSIGGEKRRFYKILLAEEPQETEECEVFNSPAPALEEKDTEEEKPE
ncbi:MAG: hypothetical protein NC398_07195 [Acetatifactor muris]|nr:hypothetical protein [Acetatifactor muris]MCM1525723.1 hypothetical protein [Bacteroides sp.]